MPRRALYLAAIFMIALGSCSKTNSSSGQQGYTANNTYGLGSISGLHNITLAKNKDTTVYMPTTVNLSVNGDARAPVSITFGPLPSAIVSYTPTLFTGIATDTSSFVTDTLHFHIDAVTIGTFPVIVTATDAGGSPSQISDTFNIIVQ